jgi:hypothetical protein
MSQKKLRVVLKKRKEGSEVFRQKQKIKKRAATCTALKHVFGKRNGRCMCARYYLERGKILHNARDQYVAGTTKDFHCRRTIKGKRKAEGMVKGG